MKQIMDKIGEGTEAEEYRVLHHFSYSSYK